MLDMMVISFLVDFPGEKLQENFSGQCIVSSGPVNFYQLIAEETLSGTRIDQIIAVPMFTTMQKISHQESRLADKFNLSHQKH